MARKSRQSEQIDRIKNYQPIRPESVLPVNRTAIYARLSLYDLNHICRDSIQNQVSLLEEFQLKSDNSFDGVLAGRNPFIPLCIE